MIAIRSFRFLYTRALSFLTITCKMESQKHASRFDLRYGTYSGLWCHKPMKELGFECDFVKLGEPQKGISVSFFLPPFQGSRAGSAAGAASASAASSFSDFFAGTLNP